MEPPEVFTKRWAEAVGQALQVGPLDEARAEGAPEYWDFVDRIRSTYCASWAIGVHSMPGRARMPYLHVSWGSGRVIHAGLAIGASARSATYRLTAHYSDWAQLLSGYDVRRAIMYRKIVMERGDLLEFFRTIHFVVECLAIIVRVPAALPSMTAIGA